MERLRYLRLTGRQRVGIWLTLLVLALLAAVVSLLWHLKPVMTSMATARVSNLVNRIVSAAVNEAVENGSIDYQNFVIFEKDETGHITALRSNVAEVNRMQGQITDEILHRRGAAPVSLCGCRRWAAPAPRSATSSPPQASTRPGTRSFWTWMCI